MPKRARQASSVNDNGENPRSRSRERGPWSRLGLLTLAVTLALASPVSAKKKGGGKPTSREVPIVIEFRGDHADPDNADQVSGDGSEYMDQSGVEAFLFPSGNFSFTIDAGATRTIELDFENAESPVDTSAACQLANPDGTFNGIAAEFMTLGINTPWRGDTNACEGGNQQLLCLQPGEPARIELLIDWEGDENNYRAFFDDSAFPDIDGGPFDLSIDVVRCSNDSDSNPDECANWETSDSSVPPWDQTWIFTNRLYLGQGDYSNDPSFGIVSSMPLQKPKGKRPDPEYGGLCALDFQIRVSCLNEDDCPCVDSDGTELVEGCVPWPG